MSILDQVQFYCVCLINRQERIDSLNKIKEIIPDIQVIEAIDGKNFTRDDIERYTKEGFLTPNSIGKYVDIYVHSRALNVGNLGSFLSHRKTIETIAKQTKPFGVVLEDDIVLEEGFLENLSNVIEQASVYEFDLLNLYVFESQRNLFPTEPNLVKAPVGLWGLQCYMIRNTHANKVLKALWPMLGATDEQITRVGLNSYVLTGIELIKGEVIKSYTNTTRTINDLVVIK